MENPYGIAALWCQGDLLIKVVSSFLLIMSIASWYIIVTRAWRIFKLRNAEQSIADFWRQRNLSEGLAIFGSGDADDPFKRLALEGQAAVNHHRSSAEELRGQINMADWLSECLLGTIEDSSEHLRKGLSILASVGSTAPFVGLFGTVWGIYHALVSIGVSGQASIDKVAGPVGEALIMTAFGLAVAIPAVLGYNALSCMNKGVGGKLQRFARQLHAYFLTGSPLVDSASASSAANVQGI